MKIKICGITTIREIRALNILLPDYMGMVFTESKRKVEIKQAVQFCNELDKKVKKVAVFRNDEYEKISAVLKKVPIDIVQLHGDESRELIKKIKENYKIEIWQGVSFIEYSEEKSKDIDKIIIDSLYPGTGKKFDWRLLEEMSFTKEVFIAGGVNVSNIDEALALKNINGIDISSGVEDINEEGIREKSYSKMKIIIEKVRGFNEK